MQTVFNHWRKYSTICKQRKNVYGAYAGPEERDVRARGNICARRITQAYYYKCIMRGEAFILVLFRAMLLPLARALPILIKGRHSRPYY